MSYLLAASMIWALSFGLIKGQLTDYDAILVSAIRLGVSAVVFLPFLLRRPAPSSLILPAAGLGVVQFGLMYVLYIASFRFLPAYLVALYTIFTPLYVVLIVDGRAGRFVPRHLAAAVLAAIGAAVVTPADTLGGSTWRGIALLQGSNLCFAAGQLAYRRLVGRWGGVPQSTVLGWMYLGAAVAVAAALVIPAQGARGGFERPALLALLYLGLIPTGLGFYLWNRGAARTRPGLLAVANNLKIPLAVVAAWLVFGESADYLRVGAGATIMVLALVVAGKDRRDFRDEYGRRR